MVERNPGRIARVYLGVTTQWRIAGLSLALLALIGCGDTVALSQSCSDVGGTDGVALEIPAQLRGAGRTVEVTVCQGSTCRSTEAPATQLVELAPGDFASVFDMGDAEVTMTVHEGRRVLATRKESFELRRSRPNGDCGASYLHGTARFVD